MKDNKKRFRILLIISIILNIGLIYFFFPSNRIKFRFMVMKILGFHAPSKVPDREENVLLTEFNPDSILKSKDSRINKFPSMPSVETHGHLGRYFNTDPESISKKLDKLNIKYFIHLSFTTGQKYLDLKKEYNDPRIIHFSTFDWKEVEKSDNFAEEILKNVKTDIKNGSKGIKLWKNFGLNVKKRNGERLKMDDPILDPLFKECEKNGLIISIHTADPPAFFYPIDRKNERYQELVNRPEWSFYGEDYPSFDEVLEERERLFKRHPKLRFIALHFGELAHDLNKADKLLTNNPNVYLDIAARIDELGRQPKKGREFLIKWQDRIFFGTDGPPDEGKFEIYSRYLETFDDYFDYYPPHKSRKGFWKIYGVGLEKEVLEKIYYKNAYSFFNLN